MAANDAGPPAAAWWPPGRLTLAVGALTLAVSTAGLLVPAVLEGLARRPGELAADQPWRLVTSLLVHDGWLPLAANLIALVAIGGVVERLVRPRTWLLLYLPGGLVGQLVGLAWQPTGAGCSVAVFGLLGGLAAGALRGRAVASVPLLYGLVLTVALLAI